MTLYKQFVDSVTGSTLPPQFRQTRTKLTVFVFLFLTALLFFSGLNVSETTRLGFESVRRDSIRPEIIRELNKDEENRRTSTLRQIQHTVFVNNVIIILILTSLTWISLYFLIKPLAKAVESKEKFLSQASHELRTPLAILYSELSLVSNEKDVKKIQTVHREALGEIKRLQQLGDTLLDRNLPEVATFSTIDVKKTIQTVWQNLKSLNAKNISLKSDFPKKIEVNTDQTRFYQLIYNIVENSLKHGQKDSIISVSCFYENKTILFTNPTDKSTFTSGIGIDTCKELATQIGVGIEFEISEGEFRAELGF